MLATKTSGVSRNLQAQWAIAMTEFGEYATYYNAVNSNKDYGGEVDYVIKLLREHHPRAASILEFGCGTGRHAALLADAGFDVVGVDASEEMLKNVSVTDRFSIRQGDARTVDLDAKFDATLALFHVASYMTTNNDVTDFFANANRHLNSGGLFIFDFWYGPAVLSQGLSNRIVRVQNQDYKIFRVSDSKLNHAQNTASVNFEIFISNQLSGDTHSISEAHTMRYFTIPELDYFLGKCGFEIVHKGEFLTDALPSLSTWGVCFVCRKIGDCA